MIDQLSEIDRLMNDIVLVSDRRFFDQHPCRQFRLRPAWRVEIEEFAHHGMRRDLPAGLCWWIAVRQMQKGFRVRVPLAAPHHFPTENTEADARAMWVRFCAPETKQFAQKLKRRMRRN